MLNFLAGVIIGFAIALYLTVRVKPDRWIIYVDYNWVAAVFLGHQQHNCSRITIDAKGYKNNDRHESEVELNFVSVENQLNNLIKGNK